MESLPVPVVAVSACLLGERVRYDGGHRLQEVLVERWSRRLRLLSFCPEAEAGLGVPRPPIQIRQVAGEPRVVEVTRPERDHTRRLQETARTIGQRLEKVDGWLFKARSPSCGVGSTPLFDGQGRQFGAGHGLVSRLLVGEGVPAAEESILAREGEAGLFLERLFVAFRWRREVAEGGGEPLALLSRLRTHLALRDEAFLPCWTGRLRAGDSPEECRLAMMGLLQRPWTVSDLERRVRRLLAEALAGAPLRREVTALLAAWRRGTLTLGSLVDGVAGALPEVTADDLWFHPPEAERALRYGSA